MNSAQGVLPYLIDLEARLREAAEIEPPEPEDGVELLLRFSKSYRAEIERRTAGIPGTLDDLARIKHAIADGGELLYCARVHGGTDFLGWYQGCRPRNELQQIANVVAQGITNMTWSLLAIEEEHPHLKQQFDNERAERAFEAELTTVQ